MRTDEIFNMYVTKEGTVEMVKKKVDPKLEPIIDKIEEFDPERAERLRVNYGGVITETSTGSDRVVVGNVSIKPTVKPPGQHSYKVCGNCGKKGAYNYGPLTEPVEYCKYCNPRKAWKKQPELTVTTLSNVPPAKPWYAKLFGFLKG